MCVGGWKLEQADTLIAQLKTEQLAEHIAHAKVVGTGSYCERLKIHFVSSDQMWVMLKAMKGLKFNGGQYRHPARTALWHSIDKTGWDIGVSKQQVESVRLLKERFATLFPTR